MQGSTCPYSCSAAHAARPACVRGSTPWPTSCPSWTPWSSWRSRATWPRCGHPARSPQLSRHSLTASCAESRRNSRDNVPYDGALCRLRTVLLRQQPGHDAWFRGSQGGGDKGTAELVETGLEPWLHGHRLLRRLAPTYEQLRASLPGG